MYLRFVLTIAVSFAQLLMAQARELGTIVLSHETPSKSFSVGLHEDFRKETRIKTHMLSKLIPGFPVFVSISNKASLTSFYAPVPFKYQRTTEPQSFLIFRDKIVLIRNGEVSEFDNPFIVDASTDIYATHSTEADIVAMRVNNRTLGFVVTPAEFQMFDMSLAPRDIRSMDFAEATNKVVVNGTPHNLAIMPLRKPRSAPPTPVKPSATQDLSGLSAKPQKAERARDIEAAFAADAAQRAADEKSGIVDLHDHNNILMSVVFDATQGDTYKDKDDKMVDLPTYLRSNFTLVEKVQRNEIDQRAFEKEIELATTGLMMAQGGSVRVTGSPGVGKSHFQDTLLAGIFTGKTSPALTNRIYLKMSAAQLGGGTKFVGSFEEKVRALKTLAAHVPVVLMIDEIHSLVGQGTHSGNNNDFFQMIKDDLALGRIKIIGMTTTNEWEKHMSTDQALVDRFSIHIKLEEPTPEKLATILANFKATRHAGSTLTLTTDQLATIAQLATRFDPINANPRKSIRLLDFILAAAAVSGVKSIDTDSIVRDASLLYNYDISALSPEKIRTRILKMNDHLDSKLVGLADAKAEVVGAVADYFVSQRSNENQKPYGIVLYGDAGAGKTELAKQTAAGLGFKFTRIMMGDYSTEHSAEAFKTKLALAIQANPFQVLLLDEVEKAHPAVQATLLRVLDEGRMSARLSPYATVDSELDASKLLIFAATNAARELPGHPHSKTDFQHAAERDGFNRYLLDRFPLSIGLPRAPVENVFEIMKIKSKEMLKQLQTSGFKVTANVDSLAEYLLSRVRPTLIANREQTNPIGFITARDQADPGVEVRFSVRDLEAELASLKRSVAKHIVMNDAHAVDLHFNQQGSLEIRTGARLCRDLF